MLESTFSGETLDGMLEDSLERHWLQVDADITLALSSR